MGEEPPTVLVTEALTLHFGLYSRTQRMRHFSHNKIRGYRPALGAAHEFPRDKKRKILVSFFKCTRFLYSPTNFYIKI